MFGIYSNGKNSHNRIFILLSFANITLYHNFLYTVRELKDNLRHNFTPRKLQGFTQRKTVTLHSPTVYATPQNILWKIHATSNNKETKTLQNIHDRVIIYSRQTHVLPARGHAPY